MMVSLGLTPKRRKALIEARTDGTARVKAAKVANTNAAPRVKRRTDDMLIFSFRFHGEFAMRV
jgi:hypothetical protein